MSARILPAVDDLSRPFWDAAARKTLAIQHCDRCQHFWHLPVYVCPTCRRGDALAWVEVSGRGKVYSYIVIRESRNEFVKTRLPLVVACVELVEQAGLRLFANILEVPHSEVTVDMDVKVAFEDLGNGLVLPQFVSLRNSN